MEGKRPKPGFLWSILSMRCPRCRRGPMFKDPNPYRRFKLSHIFDMYDNCPECGQKYDLETGFWYGTGYVSYALTVAFSATTFVAWWVLIGMSVDDDRVFWWLGVNAAMLLVFQPYLMRLSRTLWLSFFVSYDADWQLNRDKITD